MGETAVRERWTGRYLDELHLAVMTKFEQLDQDTRTIQLDLVRLIEEINHELDFFHGVRSAGEGIQGQRSSEYRPADVVLKSGEGWTDERIDDLVCTAGSGATNFGRDIQSIRDEVRVSRKELTARFANAGWRCRLRRRGRHRTEAQQCYASRTWAFTAAIRPIGPWTDGRLDDFDSRVDLDFARLDADTRAVRAEVANLRTEMRERFVACRRARFDTEMRVLQATCFTIPTLIILAGLLGNLNR